MCSPSKAIDEQQKSIIQMQSVVRGWLARKHFDDMQTSDNSNVEVDQMSQLPSRADQIKDVPEANIQVLHNALEELQRRFEKTESNLVQKEEENASLRTQVKQSEIKCSEYDTKMRSMEDMWRKQVASLQMSLAAAKKSLAPENGAGQPPGQEASPSPMSDDSDDNSLMGPGTPGISTPTLYSNAHLEARETNGGGWNPVNTLAKEFERDRQLFDQDARNLFDFKSAQSTPAQGTNTYDDFRRLKQRFEVWKREYKTRLRETKAALHKLAHGNTEKNRRRWWVRFSGKKQITA